MIGSICSQKEAQSSFGPAFVLEEEAIWAWEMSPAETQESEGVAAS